MIPMTTEGRNWSMLAHASGAVNLLLFPVLPWLAPGLVWLIKRDDAEIAPHARQAFLFQLAIWVGTWVLVGLGAAFPCFFIGWVFWLLGLSVWAAGLIFPVVGAVRVNNGDGFSYPLVGPPDPPRLRG